MIITEANPILLKCNDYALDCTARGTDLQTYCSFYPYKYFCNDQGKVKCAMKSEMCESQCKCMPQASGENVAATEDTTAGSPEVSDIVTSNSMDFLPVDQPHIKRDEGEGETTSESSDLGDTAASNPTENARNDFALVCGQNDNLLHRFCSDSPSNTIAHQKGK